ncbi:MAG: tRNA uridine-5-carboxymethylaminomethyl(34) synthesis enzyme MnmG [Bradymonadales bacterium]|nr:tRNA uridine-5-carboxymethylaminomethyl(34) synthesis enzyme MnmG [Bradymonadales bacterium]
MSEKRYNAIVIGGGHAGCEAAHALARLGISTCLMTMNLDTIAQMSCNPAIGGLAKSQLVREVDAMGGIIAQVADLAAIQYRRLNTSKGPAVWATRCQCDMAIYRQQMQRLLFGTPNLDLKQRQVASLIVRGSRVAGVTTTLGETFDADVVVITTGTFLGGLCHIGLNRFQAGRAGESASLELSQSLASLGLTLGRLKTGTTPRLDGRTIRWELTEEQPSDPDPRRLSHFHQAPLLPQRSCFITYTNEETHEVIRQNLAESPLFSGVIQGVGPRYCPSIEDKVFRFPDKDRHQVFLEPQGLDTPEVYPNGLSTSLPLRVQLAYLRSIPALQQVEITRPGYAVEYDFVPPTQLFPSLQVKTFEGLYLAGQINGTSGYEEAAAQGLMAGINAARWLEQRTPIVLRRDQAYIGVLIDDLVTRGTREPYRMFTSRAEFRLLLREDNADSRLSRIGFEIGLLPEHHYRQYCRKQEQIEALTELLRSRHITTTPENETLLASLALGGLSRCITLQELLSRPGSSLDKIASFFPEELSPDRWPPQVVEAVTTQAHYAGYIERQRRQAERLQQLEETPIPDRICYAQVAGLSREARDKLEYIRPQTLGQASRIAGITPAALTAVMIHLAKDRRTHSQALPPTGR